MAPTPDQIEELRIKYVEMLRLRLDDASPSPGDPRVAMAELAKRFPGSLREIDELPLGAIRARIEALEAARTDPAKAEPWMAALAMFHALTRGALSVKRWLGGRKEIDEECARAFALEAPALPHPDDVLPWCKDLARLASPPRGRVTDLVYERIAATLGLDDAQARLLTFGTPRRERS